MSLPPGEHRTMSAGAGTGAGRRGKILFSVNTAWNAANFRVGLLSRLMAAEYEIVIAAPQDEHVARLQALGCRFIDLPLQAHGRSPIADLDLLRRYLRIFRAERPDIFMGFTAKPNIYGSLAAAIMAVPTINNIAGLGTVFNEHGVTNLVLRRLYRLALARAHRVFFQNREDMALFTGSGIAPADRAEVLPGSGVDLVRFAPAPPESRAAGEPVTFLLVGRLLRDKGVAEFVAAGDRVRSTLPDVRLQILGFTDDGNPAFVQQHELQSWEAQGRATYFEPTVDVRPFMAAADCVVLPTYYPEGTPRALLEAAAMGKPIITTDTAGCRTVLIDGVSGFLVPPRDVTALADRMLAFAALPAEARAAMGRASRDHAKRAFDETIIANRYLAAIGALPCGRS